MATYKQVLIEWKDEPGVEYLTTVSIDEDWNDLEEDDNGIFFYFANEAEFEEAKQDKDEFEFRIIGEAS